MKNPSEGSRKLERHTKEAENFEREILSRNTATLERL